MVQYDYDPFGNIIEQTGDVNNRITYAGYQYDAETDLYYLNARYYDSKIARFISEDTYKGDPNDPLSLNLYTYCHNEPVMYTDPTGHIEKTDILIDGDTDAGKIAIDEIKKATEQWNKLNAQLAKTDKNSPEYDIILNAMEIQHQNAEDARCDYVNSTLDPIYIEAKYGGNFIPDKPTNEVSSTVNGNSYGNQVISPVWQTTDEQYSPAVQSMLLELNFDWYFAGSIEERDAILTKAIRIRKAVANGIGWWVDKAARVNCAAGDEFCWFVGGTPSKMERDEWLELNKLFQSDLEIKDDKTLAMGMFILGLALPGPGSEFKTGKNIVKSWIKHDTYNEIRNRFGMEGVKKYIKSMAKGIVGGVGETGIIELKGMGYKVGNKVYTHELKVLGKFGDFRVFGKLDEKSGHIIFDLFDEGLH